MHTVRRASQLQTLQKALPGNHTSRTGAACRSYSHETNCSTKALTSRAWFKKRKSMILSRTLQNVSGSVRYLPRLGLRIICTSQASASSEKVYELRTYCIQPASYVEFLKLSCENLHMRTAHSKLIGFWTSELGGLNEVLHLWEYGRDTLLN